MTDTEIAAVLTRKLVRLRLIPGVNEQGILVAGYDHPVTPQQGAIPQQQADSWLASDLESAKVQLLTASPSLLNASASRRAALISFVFNFRIGRYRSSTLRKKVEAGAWEEAKREIVKWVFGGGKKLPGLVSRRAEEALLLDIE